MSGWARSLLALIALGFVAMLFFVVDDDEAVEPSIRHDPGAWSAPAASTTAAVAPPALAVARAAAPLAADPLARAADAHDALRRLLDETDDAGEPAPFLTADPARLRLSAAELGGTHALGALSQQKVAALEAKLVKKTKKADKLALAVTTQKSVAAAAVAAHETAAQQLAAAQLVLQQAKDTLAIALALPDDDPSRAAAVSAAKKAKTQAKAKVKSAKKALGKRADERDGELAVLEALQKKWIAAQKAVAKIEQTLAQAAGDFDFEATIDVPCAIALVTDEGAPVAGATVQVTTVMPATLDGLGLEELLALFAAPYLQAPSGPDGSVGALLAIAYDVGKVDVVVHAAGLVGPYTNEALRTQWGPFAPSSRQTFALHELDGLVIVLEAAAP